MVKLTLPFHSVAAAIDPHYHQLKFLSDRQCSLVYGAVKEKVEVIHSQAETNVTENAEPSPKKKKTESALSFLPGDEPDIATAAGGEVVERFLREPTVINEENSLEWWRKTAERFPTLAKLTRRYLCVPGTSVPAESLFHSWTCD